MIVSIQCIQCGNVFNLEVDPLLYDAYCRREIHAQDAFPNLTPGERELFISGLCNDCFTAIFADEE